MSEKPTAAFILSLIGGVLILVAGIIIAFLGAILGAFIGAFETILPGAVGLGALTFALTALGVIFGILVIVGSVMIYQAEPSKVKNGGILVIIFSILSLFVAGGGFFIGFILALIGGILGLVWKPSAPPPPPRICPNCGAQIDIKYNVCPYCGKVIPKGPC